MSETTGNELLARQLKRAGVDTLFGVIAGPMIQAMGAAHREGIRFIGCRHEMNACFMASAWAYIKRKPGVVAVGSGPGMTNTVTPLYVATTSGMPLTVLGGSFHAPLTGLGTFQEADQMAFARPAVKWLAQAHQAREIPHLLHLALGQSLTGRPGGTYLDLPNSVIQAKVDESKVRYRDLPVHIDKPQPAPDAIERLAGMLADAERPLLILGKGAAWSDAGPAIQRLVDRGIPYVTSPMARGTLPDDQPSFMNAARGAALRGADVIAMLGGRFNWIFASGAPSRLAPGVQLAQVDVVAEEFYSGADIALGIVADAGAAAEALDAALEGRSLASADGTWLDTLAQARDRNEARMRQQFDPTAVPIHPPRVAEEVRSVLPRDASIVAEGEVTMAVARTMLPSFGMRTRLNAGTTGCMGTGVPYAIGAKLARPDAPAVLFCGDYAFGAAFNDIETAKRVGANIVCVVLNNEGVTGHRMAQRSFDGDLIAGAMLPAKYEKIAEMVDGHAEAVERPEEIRPALERALAADAPAVVHVRVDPDWAPGGGGMYLG